MDRRKFLKLLNLAIAAALPGACGQGSPSSVSTIVIGAGLAGLAAAQTLRQRGHGVMILEGRDRVGGRVWTSHQWPHLPLDLGASWIHGTEGNPLTALADQIKAQRLTTSYDRSVVYNTSGQPLSDAEGERLEAQTQALLERLEQAKNRDRDVSIQQALSPFLESLDPASEAYRWAHFILNEGIEQEYGGSINRLSTHWYDSDRAFGGSEDLLAQGLGAIATSLTEGLRIDLGQVVQEIHWQSRPVRVVTQTDEFRADRVVVTLPLGVLKANRVRFVPALPSPKQQAIATLGMGVLNKCYLQFPEAFWPPAVDWLGYIPERLGEWTTWVSFQRTARQPVLLGFNAADQGRALEARSDQQIVASALDTLRILYGARIPEPTAYQITRWAGDPFSLGSYSYNAVGSTPQMRRDLAAPLGNTLFFAGEATTADHFGTAHGAYLSGLRAAKEIIETLS
ncbi:MAG: FAD-dependent oxidoreductase [Cyanophyceae cyanobacterium]